MYLLVLSAVPLLVVGYMGIRIAHKNIKRKSAFLSQKDRYIGV